MGNNLMMKKRLLFLVVAVASLLIIAGCTQSSDAQSCKTVADCTPKKCYTSSCTENKCVYIAQQGCCGNAYKDALEDGKAGNECTCPADYGQCDGKAKIAYGSGFYDAKYVKRQCIQNQCIMGVNPDDLKPLTLLDQAKFNAFSMEVTTSFNQPFRVPTDSFTFRLTLKDAKDTLVYPIRFTHITLSSGEVLYGEKDLTAILGGVGDAVSFSVPISYHLIQPEEEQKLKYKLEYGYTLNTEVRDASGMTTVQKTFRESLENQFGTKITFAQDVTT